MKILLALSLFSLLLACDGGSMDGRKPSINYPLNLLSQTDSILSPEPRLPSYSRVAERVSMINPLTAEEVWGRSVGLYENAIPLPDLSGVSLFKDKEIRIVDENSSRVFSLANTYTQIAKAKNAPSYAFLSSDYNQIFLIHYIGNREWQQLSISLPWSFDKLKRPVEIVLNETASRLLAVNMTTGQMLIFNTNNENLFTTESRGCNSQDNNNYAYAGWYDKSQALVLSDSSGLLKYIQSENCDGVVDTITLTPDSNIVHMSPDFDNNLIVSQANGDVWQITISNHQFNYAEIILSSGCAQNVGAVRLSDSHLLLVCAKKNLQKTRVGEFFGIDSVSLDYQTYALHSQTLLNSFQIMLEESAGSGISLEHQTLYRAKDSSLGELESYELLRDVRTRVKGLYIGNSFQ